MAPVSFIRTPLGTARPNVKTCRNDIPGTNLNSFHFNALMRMATGALAAASMVLVSGCSTVHPEDTLEPFNRVMFSVNDALDRAALEPASRAYGVLPGFVQQGVGNFFGNLGDTWTAVNNLLQGKGADGVSDVLRVAVNTTFGLAGLLDVSSKAGLVKHKEDFGQTLGKWGVPAGPYIVLPVFGSTTLRDGIATPIDVLGDPWTYIRPIPARTAGFVVNAIDQRYHAGGMLSLLQDAALDHYEFVRDGYLQRRKNQIHDGEAPLPDDIDPYQTPSSSPANLKDDLHE